MVLDKVFVTMFQLHWTAPSSSVAMSVDLMLACCLANTACTIMNEAEGICVSALKFQHCEDVMCCLSPKHHSSEQDMLICDIAKLLNLCSQLI